MLTRIIIILFSVAMFLGCNNEEIKYLSEEHKTFAVPAQMQLEAYNSRDIEQFAKWFSDQVILKEFGTNEPFVIGKAELIKRYGKMFSEKTNLNCKIVSRIVCGDFVIDEELVSGLADGEIVHATAIYKIENNIITEAWFIRGK